LFERDAMQDEGISCGFDEEREDKDARLLRRRPWRFRELSARRDQREFIHLLAQVGILQPYSYPLYLFSASPGASGQCASPDVRPKTSHPNGHARVASSSIKATL
jgi:hypothetical protein